jgi:PPK2 family polyphosphate:nucleotide phosphotransferase
MPAGRQFDRKAIANRSVGPKVLSFMSLQELLKPKPKSLKLDTTAADATPGISDRDEAEAVTDELQKIIAERQHHLFVNGTKSVLVILQGMDASGKDGAIRKIFSRVNPAGVEVTSFKVPTSVEKQHDFLWRVHAAVPPHGQIGIFNRSHYEDVAVVRVNAAKLLTPEQRRQKDLWTWRFKLINGFEEMLFRSGCVVLKFFLHISKEEQKQRFIDRQRQPEKNWKLNWGDFEERRHWTRYMQAYSECIRATHTEHAPWHIVPANRKWYRNYAIATVVADKLKEMNLPPPRVSDPKLLTARII